MTGRGNVFNPEYTSKLLEKSYVGFGTIYTGDENQAHLQCPDIADPWFLYSLRDIHNFIPDLHTEMSDALVEEIYG